MITNCYINLMTKGKLSDWFEKAYLQYQIVHGRGSLDVFAEHLQIISIEDLLQDKQIQMPPPYGAFKKAERVKKQQGQQTGFDF